MLFVINLYFICYRIYSICHGIVFHLLYYCILFVMEFILFVIVLYFVCYKIVFYLL